MEARHTIAIRIKLARVEREWNQGQLAEAMGTTQHMVSRWELGKTEITSGSLVRLSNALGKPVAYFFEPLGIIQQGGGATGIQIKCPPCTPKSKWREVQSGVTRQILNFPTPTYAVHRPPPSKVVRLDNPRVFIEESDKARVVG